MWGIVFNSSSEYIKSIAILFVTWVRGTFTQKENKFNIKVKKRFIFWKIFYWIMLLWKKKKKRYKKKIFPNKSRRTSSVLILIKYKILNHWFCCIYLKYSSFCLMYCWLIICSDFVLRSNTKQSMILK